MDRFSSVPLNPRTGGGLGQSRTDGGIPAPLRSPKPCVLTRIQNKTLESSRLALQYLQRRFFGLVNIEVTRGHQITNYGNYPYFFGNMPVSQKLFLVGGREKKAFDSS